MTKPWHLDRRTVLKGAGVSLALPWLEGMTGGLSAADKAASSKLPKRLCCVMFPYGVAVPKDDSPERQWGWFPTGEGKDYELTNVLQPLAGLKQDMTVFQGLSHPRCRSMNGHDTGDTFLTANNLAPGTYKNTVSLDQLVAKYLGDKTRLASLTVSTDGGIGPRTRSTTLSYSEKGQPIPALADPKLIFQRLFGQDNASRKDRARLENSGSILDLVLEQSGDLKRKLGSGDQQKLDEFETSVRQVEQRVERSREWLDIPLPKVDASAIALNADPESAKEYISAIYDLLFLAYQTDITRVSAFQLGSYGPTLARTFPACLGLEANWHSIAHKANKKGGAEAMGKFDQFLAQNLSRFLQRMKETREGEGDSSMLDRTLVLYGSSNSRTHQNVNYPLLLAGGKNFGLKHDQFLKFGNDVPMSNLFVSMMQSLGIEQESFVDSTGGLSGVA